MKKARAIDQGQTICANAGHKQDGAATISDPAAPTVAVCTRIAFEVDQFSVQIGGRISDSDLNWMAQHPSIRNCTDDCDESKAAQIATNRFMTVLLRHLSPSQGPN